MKIVALTLTVFALSGFTLAGVIYQQSPNAGSMGYLSSTYSNGGSNLEEFVWDSFGTPTTQTLREIQWRGPRSGPAPLDFQISINTIAIPGGTVWHTNGVASETPTATPGVYDYKFTLPAGFVLTGGQGYWLQVIGLVDNYYPYWQWSAGTGGNGSHLAQVPAVTGDYRYVGAGGDVAFTLLNQATVPVTITLAKAPAAGGTVTGGGTYSGGANVTATATAASGRTFLNWTEAGVIVSTSASFSFAADGNKTLTANFSGPNTGPYMINAIANPSVNGTVGGAGMVNAGEIRELDVTPADGLSFVGWTENGEIVNLPFNAATQVFEVTATADRTLVANFAYPAYTSFINGVVSPVSSGTMVIAGTAGLSGGSYYGGTLLTINATPYPGYHFAYWKQGAGLGDISGAPHVVGTNPTLKHMVCYGTTITAYFEPNNPVLTLASSPVAGGTNTGAGTFAHSSNVTVNATPAVGYAFANWKEGSTIKSTSPSYSFTITNHTTLTAAYIATNRTITASAAPLAGGSVSGSGVVGNGATVTLTATPSSGYIFSNWTLSGAPAGSTNPITFTASADYTFVANFIALPVVSISAPAGGGLGFSWPESATGWVLQESPDLSPASWVNSALPVTTSGGQNQISIPNPTGSLFFRLARP
ncbi:MAG: hypothetical protein JNM99_20415 [Verrucomicrobiaceae bacterium]|nr:hypothetical protein [Verrucomicrobiaceae bacterium]